MNLKTYRTLIINTDTQIPFWKCHFFGHYVKSEPENSLQTLLSLVVFHNRTNALSWRKLGQSHWSQFSLMKFWSFSFSMKRKQSILVNSPFLSVSSITVKQHTFNLATWRKKTVYGRWFAFMRKNRHIMMSCTRNLARAPSHWVRSTVGALRHLETKLE